MANSSCLWTQARNNLPTDVEEWLTSLEQGIQPNATASEQIDTLIEQTTKKQKDLERSHHRFRKCFDKIIHWLDKVKGIGDVISSFDPVHAALPWAAFRFALQAILAEREQSESVLELLASIPHFVFSGRVLEMVYMTEPMHVGETEDDVKISQHCLNSLQEELIKLYSGLLGALKYCYSISSRHKVKRKATAIFNSSEVVNLHKDLDVQHRKVVACGEKCHKILSHTLSCKSLDLLEKIQPSLSELGDRVRELLVRIDESEQRKTLAAISSILFRAHHEEVSRKRTAGTCEWILKRETFIRWDESDSSVTILYGNPGAGKTFLVSRVVNYSVERAKAGEAVAFFYCKRDEENRRNPKDILRSILRQLSTPINETGGGTIHVALKDLSNKLALNGTDFDVSTCERLIRMLIEDYSRTTIILDALDECDRNTREELIRVLSNLTNGSSKLRVFISSRPDEDILRHFKGTPVMEIQATDNEKDISSFVEDKLFQDARWADISSEFQEDVKSVFHKKSQGMFQWAALQVDQIRRLKLWSERSIGEQLEASPIGLKGAYDVVWNQIQEMSPYEERLARRALKCALCAFEPLETSDLLLMMQLDPNSGDIEADTVFTPKTIQSICGNLLVSDPQSNVWRFSHLSAREYIERHHYTMLESHYHVAISSIKFLDRDLVPLPPGRNIFLELKPPIWVIATHRSHPDGPCVKLKVQCRYIVKHVFRHAHELELPKFRHSELTNLLQNFFKPTSQGSSAFRAWKHLSYLMYDPTSHMVRMALRNESPLQLSSTPFQVMSIYGLFHIVRDLWETAEGEFDVCPMSTPSPLTLAVLYGHESVWKFILLANANLNNGNPGPLTAAIRCDNMIAFKAILEAGADVNYFSHRESRMVLRSSELRKPNTPLEAALTFSSKRHRRYIIQKLLDRGADVNTNLGLMTTLELAVQFSGEKTVRALLDANTKVYNPDHLLSLAAQNRKSNLVPLFVNAGANIEEPWEGVLPIVWALRRGNLPVVQSLLEMLGSSIDLSCQDHREAILSALWQAKGRNLFLSLFGSNPHINWMDCEAETLRWALRSYPEYEYELSGLGLNASNFARQCDEGTAQHQLSLVNTLFNAGADPSVSVSFGSGSTLTAAALHGRLHHVRALLDQKMFKVKQQQRAICRTALLAMLSGHLGTVSRKSTDKQGKPFGSDCVCPRYLEVLLRLFDGDLSVYMPIYDFLDTLTSVVYINGEGNAVNNSCRLYAKGFFGCFSRLWLSIVWDLQNSTSPQLPLRSQLRQWQFPGILPPKCFVVAKVTTFSKARSTYFITLSICGNRSHFSLLSAPQRVREPLSHRSEGGRWKRYKPESFGITRFTNPDGGIESGNSKVPAARGNCNANASCYGNMFALVLASVVVLLSFFMALLQLSQRP